MDFFKSILGKPDPDPASPLSETEPKNDPTRSASSPLATAGDLPPARSPCALLEDEEIMAAVVAGKIAGDQVGRLPPGRREALRWITGREMDGLPLD